MKVNVVSMHNLGFRSEIDMPYLYTLNKDYKPRYTFKDHKAEYIGGIAAFIVAAIALSKFAGRNIIPQKIVELKGENANLGLGRIKNAGRTVTELKNKILYPMKCMDMGERRILYGDFKTGLIIGDTNPKRAQKIKNAFLEHAELLGIHCERIRYPRKENRLKEVRKAFKAAQDYHDKTGKCVIVDAGDLALITNLKVSKTEAASNIEKGFTHTPKGILWVSWTSEADKLPYFYNNLPVLMTKIVE